MVKRRPKGDPSISHIPLASWNQASYRKPRSAEFPTKQETSALDEAI